MKRLAYLALVLAAMAAMPAAAQVWIWSPTASTNSNVDSTINFQEGQPPSSLNDSDRAMMARLAQYRNDIAGSALDTGGSGSAYAVASSSGSAATPQSGQQFCFIPAHTNLAGVTLSVDSGGAFAIQSPLGTNIPANTMIAATPYCVEFNSGSNIWVLAHVMGTLNQSVAQPITVAILNAAVNFTSNNTLTNLLSISVITGHTYWFEAHLPMSAGLNGTGGVQVSIQCTCTASSVQWDTDIFIVNNTVQDIQYFTAFGSLGINDNQFTNSHGYITIRGSLVTTASGSLSVQGSQSVSNATTTTFAQGGNFKVGLVQ